MPEKYELTPATTLTKDIVNNLVQHSTISSLRRACAVSPCIFKVDATEDMPTIYYVKGSIDPTVEDWTMHALTTDLITFLLNGQVEEGGDEPEPEPEPIQGGGIIEITSPNELTSYTDDGNGRIDIPNGEVSAEAVTLEVTITMDDENATYTGKFFTGETMPENPGNMTAVDNVLTAEVALEANTPAGTPIYFLVNDGTNDHQFMIAYGSAE